MELILITGRKLKIMLTADDMKAYRLDCSNMDYDNTETRRAFWSILDEAKHRTGFDAASERVMIRVFPCRSGGCEMFVTKLTERKGSNIVSISGAEEKDENELYGIYSFTDINDLLKVCDILARSGFTGRSEAYYSDTDLTEKKRYYLLLFCRSSESKRFAFINEYGKELRSGIRESYIKEHCVCLCPDNAVEILSELA
ncbi:MAG: adaptor protein MecA [Clostridia bacterium]|nr:adaptor protein MecA [Clostridia bacterium]